MKRASKQWINNFLIKSSFSVALKESLSCEARQAYWLRDFARLKIAGEGLVKLSADSESIGRYYLALARERKSVKSHTEAKREFELLTESSNNHVRIASMIAAAGAGLFLNESGEFIKKLLLEASALALGTSDHINFIQAQSQLSLLCSLNENHLQSLEILRGLQKIVDKSDNNIIQSDYYNSVSYELAKLGRWEAARGFASFVVRSPYLAAYPEWQENAKEIFVKKPSRSFVVVKKNNILQFPIQKLAVQTGELIYKFKSKEYYLRDLQPDKLIRLCEWIDADFTASQSLENNAK